MNKKQSQSLVDLVAALSDGEFHDGNTLGEELGMTRSAVWKAIKKLMHYGALIQSDKRKGYALTEPLTLLDQKEIQAHIPANAGLHLFETITSTNDYLKAARFSAGPQFCLAEQQTQGRGRLNRVWVSPFAKNIYLSCLYPFTKDISELAGLSLVACLAVRKALLTFDLGELLKVKWPNDIMYDGQKLSGMLIEVQAESHGFCRATIGVGINVNMLAADIEQAWVSMRAITGKYIDRNKIVVSVISHLLNYLARFCEKGFDAFIDEWMAADGLLHKEISLKNINTTLTGKVVGVNKQGHLLLASATGEVHAYSSGDASILK